MKTTHNKVLVFYHFQLDHNKEHNVTSLPNNGQPIAIKDVLQVLPLDLSQGLYHFRFKSEMMEGNEKVTAWIDINNLKAKVPQINGSIFIKILKLRQSHHNKLFHLEKLKRADIVKSTNHLQNGHDHAANSAPKDFVHTQPTPRPSQPVNGQPQGGSSSKNTPTNHQPKSPPPPSKVQKSTEDVIKMPAPTATPVKSPPAQATKGESFINFDSPQQPKGEGLSKDVQQNLETFDRQFKDEETNRQNERVAASEFEERLRKWGYTDGKKINNLTTLLATLHEIWPEWQPVSLVDMLSQDKVNALFKKAVIKVHPDKNRNRNFKEKYLSKRIFELLNEARKQQQ